VIRDVPVRLPPFELMLLNLTKLLLETCEARVLVVGSLGVGGDLLEERLLLLVHIELAAFFIGLDSSKKLLPPLLPREIRPRVSEDPHSWVEKRAKLRKKRKLVRIACRTAKDGERQEEEEGGGREELELTFWEEILEEKSV